tara:strand:- start:1137 stop:3065 length:1929 start_codon:yes stop_codon:yes gene_type:complete
MHFKLLVITLFIVASLFSKSIGIITTNDLHGNIAPQKAWFMNPSFPPDILGGAGLIKYINESREISDSEIFVFDAGNFFQGHPFGMVDGGSQVISWMNRAGYTALVPGANDFILGSENLNRLANEANFPFIISNIKCNKCNLDSDNIKPYIIKDIDGIKVGILGIINTAIPDLTSSVNIKGIEFENSIKSLEKWVSFLKNKNVDSIIVLTSSGIPWDREEEYAELDQKVNQNLIDPYDTDFNALGLGRFAEDIDIIISGGVSKGYNLPWYDPYSHVYIFQNYGNGTGFGHFEMLFDSKTNIFQGYKSMVDGKVGQTLLDDDFDFDFSELDKIKSYNKRAKKDLYAPLDVNEKSINQFTNINQKKADYNQWNIPSYGKEANLEVMSWNCEFFPAAGDSTIKAMSEVITDLDIDIIAFQEIKKAAWFEKLMRTLPEYDYVISKNSSFFDQAYIYKKEIFSFIRDKEPFSDNDYNFAGRPPLRLDLMLEYDNLDIPISLVNLHMKCCDSGLKRRQKASQMLFDYLDNEISETGYSNFIVLGDWNDDLNDEPDEHCFNPFLNGDKFYFLTDRIDDDIRNATYPKEPYVSFLDHIMTTTSFIEDNLDVEVKTVMIEDYIGGFEVYEILMSDHRPVMFSIPFSKLPKN